MNFEQIQKWEQIRNKGRVRYILFHWGLFWGSLATVIMELLRIFANALPLSFVFSAAFLRELIGQWIFFLIIGSFAGWYSWSKAERDYQVCKGTQGVPDSRR